MIYFESLHPASPSLTKQVQRAVSSLNLARDENGYFMIHKTVEEYQAEQELARLLETASLSNLHNYTPVFIKTEPWKRSILMQMIASISEMRMLYETIAETGDGLILYTKFPDKLIGYLSDFIEIDADDQEESTS